ncbi:hypothetical protein [Shewanella xiamenensis]|uniref:hypothetical protein n=1 Tax=Shewanella xiamenensis TaxID=332186 RepID=UPI00217E5A0E|nr:hypothetical protein [Shewanella xiamenensis]MCT8870423.1 hypothetical protein [Shewanella xiamenensis]UWH40771.1 hypothetical protein KXJ80_16040 [Shewanella xiamenensis]
MQLKKLKTKSNIAGLFLIISITAFFWFSFINSILISNEKIEGVLFGYDCKINSRFNKKYDYDIYIENGGRYSSLNSIDCKSLDGVSLIVRGKEVLSVSQNEIELVSYSSLSKNHMNRLASTLIAALLLTMFSIWRFKSIFDNKS